MLNKWISKIMSVVLLLAILSLTIPFQQIFHHHKEQVSFSGKIKSVLNSYEKPCCKASDFFHHAQAIIQEQSFVFFSKNYSYQQAFYNDAVFSSTFSTTNKAPPLA